MSGEASEACLLVTGSGKTFPLDSGVDSRSVSRLHALIQRRDAGDYYLIDLGSRNGPFVNRRRVSLPLRLHDEDQLVFAEQELVFRNPTGTDAHATAGTSTRNLPTESLHNESLTTILVVDIRDFTTLSRLSPRRCFRRPSAHGFCMSARLPNAAQAGLSTISAMP